MKLRTAKLCLIVLLMTGCGSALLVSRAILAGSRPFLQSLVTAKKITQEQADTTWHDVSEGVDDFAAADAQLKLIPKTDAKNLRQIKKAQVYKDLAFKLRTILERHNIGGSPELDQIGTIVQGAIDALEEYYRAVTGAGDTAQGMSSAAADQVSKGADADAKLKAAMEEMKTKLKAVMSPK